MKISVGTLSKRGSSGFAALGVLALFAMALVLRSSSSADISHPGSDPPSAFYIPLVLAGYDNNESGIDDALDIVEGARAFLRRHATVLTTEVEPYDRENLAEWQRGDIVVFGRGYDHIGIVSDKRARNGVPLVIHHAWQYPTEDNALEYWPGISGHFRLDLGKLATTRRSEP